MAKTTTVAVEGDERFFLDGRGSMWAGDLQPLDGEDRYIHIGGGCQLAVVDVDRYWRVQVIPPGYTGSRLLLLASPVGMGGADGRRAVARVLREWAEPITLTSFVDSGPDPRDLMLPPAE